MPIMWRCTCGKLLKSKDEFAGCQAPCPACNAVHTRPNGKKPADLQEEVFDAELVEELEPQQEVLDALPVAEWEEKTSGSYAFEPDGSDEEPDSEDTGERDRPPPRRPRASRHRRRRPITFDDSEDGPRHYLRQDWFADRYVIFGASSIFFAFVFFLWRMAFRPPGPISVTILAITVLIGVACILKGVVDKIQH
jgi:hypothetical protein